MVNPPARSALPAALAALVLLGILLLLGLRPPAPRPVDAPANEFSAMRAIAILERILGDGAPHPAGSDEHAEVRRRIIAELEALGYDVHVQRTIPCRGGRCIPVENIVTRLPGRGAAAAAGGGDRGDVSAAAAGASGGRGVDPSRAGSRGAVLLASHYDSHPRGPGAADAGASVAAIVEIARIVREDAPYRNDVILLLTDAEEYGLFGAQAFVSEHPWAADVALAINLEARGTSGPSIMFETSTNNRGLVREFARAVRRPVASSLTYDVYRLLPNDTDATVFGRAGMAVLNFAFIDDVVNYHTERDDLDHLNPRSVQHHGDNALAVLRRFADLPLTGPEGVTGLPGSAFESAGDAAYADLFGIVVVRWPARWQLPLALAFAAVIVTVAATYIVRRTMRPAELVLGVLATLFGLAAALVFGFAVGRMLPDATTRAGFQSAGSPGITALLWTGSVATVLAVGFLFARRARAAGLFFGAWLVIAALCVALAAVLPGAAVVLAIPLASGALAAAALGMRGAPRIEVPATFAALGAGITLIPLAFLLEATFVLQLPFAITMVVGLCTLPLMALVRSAPPPR